MRPAPSLLLLAFALPAIAQAGGGVPAPSAQRWTATWATSVVGPEQSQPPVEPAKLTDATVREIVHLSVGGNVLRVQFSNAFGTAPLRIDAAAMAVPVALDGPRLVAGSSHPLTFSGQPSVLIPVGATYISDPVTLRAAAGNSVAISFHLPSPPATESAHPGSRATSYLAAGNHVGETDLPGAERVVRWMQIAEVDVASAADHTVVALGDSITDGHAAGTDRNERWTDSLAAHLRAAGQNHVAVVNEGIGGNHLLTNGLGESVLERFDRDVLGVAGVHEVVLLEGINDLGGLSRNPAATAAMHTDLAERMEAAYVQVIERAHAHGIRVYGATITPDGGSGYYHPNAADNATREAVNAWIREPGHFDGFVDLDKVVRDPAHPDQLLPAYDSGDHLHPGPAGYKAMGEAIPLAWFR